MNEDQPQNPKGGPLNSREVSKPGRRCLCLVPAGNALTLSGHSFFFFNLFIFGCIGSSLLQVGFL